MLPADNQKTFCFLIFLGGVERDQRHEIGYWKDILYFLNSDGMSHDFSTWQKQNITIHVLLFFWVNCSKVKTGMFKVLHYPHPANIYRFYYWLWICKCLLVRIVKFIFKSFPAKNNFNCLKRSNVEWVEYTFQSRVWDGGLNSGKALYSWV